MIENLPLVVILGPTASGKTNLAVHLANKLEAEIISADSRQVYRKLNIGTGKDYQEYTIGGKKIPCHMIDVCEPDEYFDLSLYLRQTKNILANLARQGKQAILCGGSGLYIKAVLQDYKQTQIPVNKELRQKLNFLSPSEIQAKFNEALQFKPQQLLLDGSTTKRQIRAIEMIDYLKTHSIHLEPTSDLKYWVFGINPALEQRRTQIALRLQQRLANGLIEEVKQLLEQGIRTERMLFFGLEYKFVTEFLQNRYSFEELKTKLTTAIQQFAKRQMTFFRHLEKEGIHIHWLESSDNEQRLEEILYLMNNFKPSY